MAKIAFHIFFSTYHRVYCQVLDVLLTLTNFFYKLNPSIARVIYLDGRVGEREVKV